MGCAEGRVDEQPVHRVWVDAFEISAYAVTNREYAEFLAATGYPEPSEWHSSTFNHPEQPVVAVNWYDATAYCQWLSRVTGKTSRLPAEAEWEKAARGGLEGRLYTWGDTPPELRPDYSARWQGARPEPVGRYEPNGFGLYNIGDNVHEWCLDWYDPEYYKVSPEGNPQGPASGTRRASRGGSWRHQVKISRCAARSSLDPSFKYTDYGFRVLRPCRSRKLLSAGV